MYKISQKLKKAKANKSKILMMGKGLIMITKMRTILLDLCVVI